MEKEVCSIQQRKKASAAAGLFPAQQPEAGALKSECSHDVRFPHGNLLSRADDIDINEKEEFGLL